MANRSLVNRAECTKGGPTEAAFQIRKGVLAAVEENGDALECASNEFRSDREIVLAAVKQDGRALQYASNELQGDREFILAAVKQDGHTLQFASNELRRDREIVLAAVKQDGRALQYASNELQGDREIVLAAVKQDGHTLQFASNEFRSDREIVLVAVKQDGRAIEHASNELRRDREIVMAAVEQDGHALRYASNELRMDREIVLLAVSSFGCALQFAESGLRRDRGVVLAAMLQDGSALRYAADESLWSDERLLREVSERRAVARHTSVDTRFTLDPSWDASTAANFVSEKFAASGKLACAQRCSCAPTGCLCPLVGYRITSIELLSNATCAAATSALSRMWEYRPRHTSGFISSEQLAVQRVFDELLRESGGDSLIVYHGCSASAARSIAEHGFIKSSQPDDGYFGRGIYATPNAEYACRYATTAHHAGAVVMCRACVPSVYCVTLADYDGSDAACHSRLYGQALKSEEAHFALVSQNTHYEACTPETAEYCELCVSQVAALCPIAVLLVAETVEGEAAFAPTATSHFQPCQSFAGPPTSIVVFPQSTALQRHAAPSHLLDLREDEIGVLPSAAAREVSTRARRTIHMWSTQKEQNLKIEQIFMQEARQRPTVVTNEQLERESIQNSEMQDLLRLLTRQLTENIRSPQQSQIKRSEQNEATNIASPSAQTVKSDETAEKMAEKTPEKQSHEGQLDSNCKKTQQYKQASAKLESDESVREAKAARADAERELAGLRATHEEAKKRHEAELERSRSEQAAQSKAALEAAERSEARVRELEGQLGSANSNLLNERAENEKKLEAAIADAKKTVSTATQKKSVKSESDDNMSTAPDVMKIVVVGNRAAGKTSLVRRYVLGTFSERTTVGADFYEKTLTVGEANVMLQLWDVGGQEEIDAQSHIYRRAKGALVVCDASRPESMDFALQFKAYLEEHCPKIPAVLVINKIDLLSSPLKEDELELEEFCAHNEFYSWVAVSAKKNTCVEKPFWEVANAVIKLRSKKECNLFAERMSSAVHILEQASSSRNAKKEVFTAATVAAFVELAANANTSESVRWLASAICNITNGATQPTKEAFASPAVVAAFSQLAPHATTAEAVECLSRSLCDITSCTLGTENAFASRAIVPAFAQLACSATTTKSVECLSRALCDITVLTTKDAFTTPAIIAIFSELASQASTPESVQWLSRAMHNIASCTTETKAVFDCVKFAAFAQLASRATTAQSVQWLCWAMSNVTCGTTLSTKYAFAIPLIVAAFSQLASHATTAESVHWLSWALSNVTNGTTQSTKDVFATPETVTMFSKLARNATAPEAVQWLSISICSITSGATLTTKDAFATPVIVAAFSQLAVNATTAESVQWLATAMCSITSSSTQSTKDAFATPVIVGAFTQLAVNATTAESVRWLATAISTITSGTAQSAFATPEIVDAFAQRTEVPFSSIRLRQRIATGSCGAVFVGILDTNETVAIKELAGREGMQAIRESSKHMMLHHRNIVRMCGVSQDGRGHSYIITELAPGGSLADALKSHPQRNDWATLVRWALDIAHGLQYLHSLAEPVLHVNLKPQNVLLFDDDTAKLCDYVAGACNKSAQRSPHYAAPEQFALEPISAATDVYGFGGVLFAMITKSDPWAGLTMFQICGKLSNGTPPSLPSPLPADCPDTLASIVQRCLQIDPKQRCPLPQVIEDLNQVRDELASPNSSRIVTQEFTGGPGWLSGVASAQSLLATLELFVSCPAPTGRSDIPVTYRKPTLNAIRELYNRVAHYIPRSYFTSERDHEDAMAVGLYTDESFVYWLVNAWAIDTSADQAIGLRHVGPFMRRLIEALPRCCDRYSGPAVRVLRVGADAFDDYERQFAEGKFIQFLGFASFDRGHLDDTDLADRSIVLFCGNIEAFDVAPYSMMRLARGCNEGEVLCMPPSAFRLTQPPNKRQLTLSVYTEMEAAQACHLSTAAVVNVNLCPDHRQLPIKLLSDERTVRRSDDKVVLLAEVQDGLAYDLALQCASNELRSDREIVLAAVRQSGLVLYYAANELRSDREIVLAAVRQNGLALEHASDKLRSDREIVLAAVRQNGLALQHVSSELRSDREIVLAAVRQDGLALRYVSSELRSDREIVLAAVRQDGLALEHALDELRSDREIVLAAVRQDGLALRYVSSELRSDREIVLAAVRQDGLALEHASDELRVDREVVLAAVGCCATALRFVARSLRSDREIVLLAVLQDKAALQCADDSLRADDNFMLEVSERAATARYTAAHTPYPSWDLPAVTALVSYKFAASGKLACPLDLCAPSMLSSLVGYRISSTELLSNATRATPTSAFNRMWGSRPRRLDNSLSCEQLAVRKVFDGLLRERAGSLIVYHGCSASAARSIAEHGFTKSSLRDDGYFGRGIYATPNAEYACEHAIATACGPAAVVMCHACVTSVYFVTRADYDGSIAAAGHSKLYGQPLRSEEAHFALVSRNTCYEACAPNYAEYCELCFSQAAALCPIAIMHVETIEPRKCE